MRIMNRLNISLVHHFFFCFFKASRPPTPSMLASISSFSKCPGTFKLLAFSTTKKYLPGGKSSGYSSPITYTRPSLFATERGFTNDDIALTLPSSILLSPKKTVLCPNRFPILKLAAYLLLLLFLHPFLLLLPLLVLAVAKVLPTPSAL